MNMLFSKKLISAFIAVLIILSTFTIAFADSDEPAAGSEVSSDPAPFEVTSNVEQELLAPDLRNPVYLKVAQDLKASTATTYDIDDIYYVVQECANALVEYDGTEFVSVTEYVHACLSGLANGLFNGSSSNPYLGSINSNIASIQAAVYGPAWDGSGVTNSLWNALQTLYSVNHADQLAQMAKQQGIIDALVGNTQYSLSNKLTNFQNDLNNINWSVINPTINSYDSNFNIISSFPASTSQVYIIYTFNPNQRALYKFSIPYTNAGFTQEPVVKVGFYNSNVHFLDYSDGLFYVYFRNFNSLDIYVYQPAGFYNNNGVFAISLYGNSLRSNPSLSPYSNVYYLPDSSSDFYSVLNSLINYHSDNDIHYQNNILNRFKDLYASDDLIASKQAQQQYEQDSLTDFTGGGSAAASGTDRNGLKSVSNTAKSGFDSGGSISDGLSVFNSNNSIWGWFSQDNASYFTTNRSLMKSNNNSELITEIPDYLSTSDKYMIDNLGDNYDESNSK